MHVIHPRLTNVRSTVARRRTVRNNQRRLARELAQYDTPSARSDLDAMLLRHSDEQSAPIRRIMHRV